ncbi:DEAD/DEAH box helicase [Kitasatospora sp. NA04385]|uniref:DEAD/DEAH box helicase n=1 Tax=Kitasatospora sp. NA04385 TaxID=2742135 RepID=UPI001590CB3A|nr:DEAD/DEAH box helicase [Kitasatospora sp. NA04385]QKW22518.1 DEAD/DEAH box helicase [Kitasatospora sp. NA04385]
MAGGGVRRARDVVAVAERQRAAARALVADHAAAVGQVAEAHRRIFRRLVRAELAAIPVERLKDVTEGRLQTGALRATGYTTVAAVRDATRQDLLRIPGIGGPTAAHLLAAAGQIATAVEEGTAVRLDPARPDAEATALVTALHRLVLAGPAARRAAAEAAELDARYAAPLAEAAYARGRLRGLLAGAEKRERAWRAVESLAAEGERAEAAGAGLRFAQASADLLRPPAGEVEVWVEFEHRAAEFYAELAVLAEDGRLAGPTATDGRAAAEGHLPDGLAEQVRAQPLDDRGCTVSLRGYQAFGARFALARKKVVIGDEMGLGKTVQSLAVLAHLAAAGQGRRFLVVCPASVLVNWQRETAGRTTLTPHRYHGPGREAARERWLATGGVLVATYESLRTLAADPVTALVVDEAHFVKNPAARRTRLVAEWAARTEHVLFLTGTPMENRVEEFRTLIGHLQPELLADLPAGLGALGPLAFRRAVAPAYLRRNQQDVLTELPDVVRVDEWDELSGPDRAAYAAAVAEGNFMAMRRAAYADPAHSAKLRRLRELVAEAAESGHKVVVFSYFREVLAAVHGALGAAVTGTVAGSLPAEARQELVDAFTAADGHAVLLCQIQAGGLGLNLQAANVVILCEPQLKPTLEDQAVARAQRMGQIRRVRVHRLLAADSLDRRLVELLRGKAELFDQYARRSDLAEAAPEAVDVSDRALAVRIVEDEQLRLAGSADRPAGAVN